MINTTLQNHAAVKAIDRSRASRAERWLGLFTSVRPGEGKGALLFFGYAFLLLVCYYVLKTLREPLLLEDGSAELKSYAYAVIALVLMAMVPLYSALFRRTGRRQLIRWVTGFFVASLALVCLLGRLGVDVGFVYYVWVGVFGVTMLAQFWAHAAHTHKVESGQRLFPVIMAGAALGGLAGPPLFRGLFPVLGPWNLMVVAMGLLAATLPLVEWTWNAVPRNARNGDDRIEPASCRLLGGFALVMREHYLLLLAVLVVLLNCVNATGEYILTELVIRHANDQVTAHPDLDKGNLIAGFYGDYYLVVNALTVVFQVCLVGRVFRWIGVRGAVLVLPVIALVGYGLVVFLPVFGLIRAVKILENSTDYSIMNTARHALYLPLAAAQKYEGKTAIDTFFWRLGDLLQAGVIYVGLNWLGFEFQDFAMLNMLLALVWIGVAARIGGHYAGSAARRELVISWRTVATGVSAAALAATAMALPADAAAERLQYFVPREPLALEYLLETRGNGTGNSH